MADPPNPADRANDPRSLSVEVGLLSGEGTKAAKDLAAAFKSIADTFKVVETMDFARQAERLEQAAKNIAAAQKESIETMQRSGRESPYTSTPQRASEIVFPAGSQAERDQQRRQEEEGQRREDERRRREEEEKARQDRKREAQEEVAVASRKRFPILRGLAAGVSARVQGKEFAGAYLGEQPPDAGLPGSGPGGTAVPQEQQDVYGPGGEMGQGYGGGGGGDYGGVRAKFAGGRPPDDRNAWYNRTDLSQLDRPMQLPRYGDLNIQDYLRVASQRQLQRAAEAQRQMASSERSLQGVTRDTDPNEVDENGLTVQERAVQLNDSRDTMDRYGRSSAMYNNLAEQGAPQAFTYYQGAKRLAGRFGITPQDFNPINQGDTGGQLGFERGQFGPIPDPFSSASQEGWRQTKDRMGLQFRHGINAQQSQAIINATAGAGFSGDMAHDISYRLMAPQMQNYGLDPQALVPLTQNLRTGTASVSQLNEALSGLGQASQNASMTVTQSMEAWNKVAEDTQQRGGTHLQGFELGRDFQASTGLPGDAAIPFTTNGFASARIMANTGVPIGMQGALPNSERMRGGLQSVEQLNNMFKGVYHERRSPIMVGGRRVGTTVTSEEKLREAAIAQQTGMPVSQIHQILNRKGFGAVPDAMAAQEGYTQNIHRLRQRHLHDPNARREFEQRMGGNIEWDANGNPQFKGGNKHDIFGVHPDKMLRENWSHEAAKYARAHSDKSVRGDDDVQWGELRASAHRMGVSDKRLDEIKKEQKPERRARMVRDAINKKVGDANKPVLEVKFTGAAAKVFKGQVKNLPMPDNSSAASAAGPSPLPSNDWFDAGASSGASQLP
jgi:hypothetical protein